jgi:hypothetical protein
MPGKAWNPLLARLGKPAVVRGAAWGCKRGETVRLGPADRVERGRKVIRPARNLPRSKHRGEGKIIHPGTIAYALTHLPKMAYGISFGCAFWEERNTNYPRRCRLRETIPALSDPEWSTAC